jgi:hypothetical protein
MKATSIGVAFFMGKIIQTISSFPISILQDIQQANLEAI